MARVLDFQIVIQRTKIPYVMELRTCTDTVKIGNIISVLIKFNFIFNTILRRGHGRTEWRARGFVKISGDLLTRKSRHFVQGWGWSGRQREVTEPQALGHFTLTRPVRMQVCRPQVSGDLWWTPVWREARCSEDYLRISVELRLLWHKKLQNTNGLPLSTKWRNSVPRASLSESWGPSRWRWKAQLHSQLLQKPCSSSGAKTEQ